MIVSIITAGSFLLNSVIIDLSWANEGALRSVRLCETTPLRTSPTENSRKERFEELFTAPTGEVGRSSPAKTNIGSATLAFRLMNRLLNSDDNEDVIDENFNIMITHKCPFDCAHCLAKDALKSGKRKDVKKDRLFALFDQLRGFKRIHIVGSGEPLAYGKSKLRKGGVSKDFLDIVRYAAERIQEVRIVTNGYLFPEDVAEARKFFAQFPKNIVWQLSVDDFHKEQFARMPGRDEHSLQEVVVAMEQLAEKGKIKTAYSMRVETNSDKRKPLRDFYLVLKSQVDPDNVFVNSVVAQGNARDNVYWSRDLDNRDIRNHGTEPENLFPFIDTDGYFVTSDHVAYMTKSQRERLLEDVSKQLIILGNTNSSSLGEIIVSNLILYNYRNKLGLGRFDKPTFKHVMKALAFYLDGNKKAAIDIMSGLANKKEVPGIVCLLLNNLESIPIGAFIRYCEKNGISIMNRRGTQKINLDAAIRILQEETEVFRDFETAIIETYYFEVLGLLYLCFLGPCPTYRMLRDNNSFYGYEPIRGFYGDDYKYHTSMQTKSPKAIERRFTKDMELAADGIAPYPVGALYDRETKQFFYITMVEYNVGVEENGVDDFIDNLILSGELSLEARRLGRLAAKLDKHNVTIKPNKQNEWLTELAQLDNGEIMIWGGDYVITDGSSTSKKAEDVFRKLLNEACAEQFDDDSLSRLVSRNFKQGYRYESSKTKTSPATKPKTMAETAVQAELSAFSRQSSAQNKKQEPTTQDPIDRSSPMHVSLTPQPNIATISQQSFGEIGRNPWHPAHRIHEMEIAGFNVSISGTRYIRIDIADRVIFLATEHSGAYYLTVDCSQKGIITGQEIFAHIDYPSHPDNAPVNSSLPALSESIEAHAQCINDQTVDLMNYITALSRQFPEMEFSFLKALERPDSTWGGMNFDWQGPIYEFDRSLAGGISSIDLDTLLSVFPQDSAKFQQKLLEVVYPSKVIMMFISPSHMDKRVYLGIDFACNFIETLLSKLNVAKVELSGSDDSMPAKDPNRSSPVTMTLPAVAPYYEAAEQIERIRKIESHI